MTIIRISFFRVVVYNNILSCLKSFVMLRTVHDLLGVSVVDNFAGLYFATHLLSNRDFIVLVLMIDQIRFLRSQLIVFEVDGPRHLEVVTFMTTGWT